jgi:hypothetical protein
VFDWPQIIVLQCRLCYPIVLDLFRPCAHPGTLPRQRRRQGAVQCLVPVTVEWLQAEREGAVIKERLHQRELSEESQEGRISMEQVKGLMAQLQANRGNEAAIERLALKFRVPIDAVRQLERFNSIPAVHSDLIGQQHGMVAQWQ